MDEPQRLPPSRAPRRRQGPHHPVTIPMGITEKGTIMLLVTVELFRRSRHERYCLDNGHEWELHEDGYSRRWDTEIDGDGTITATFGGPEDWSDQGDGALYLECLTCYAVNDDVDADKIKWE